MLRRYLHLDWLGVGFGRIQAAVDHLVHGMASGRGLIRVKRIWSHACGECECECEGPIGHATLGHGLGCSRFYLAVMPCMHIAILYSRDMQQYIDLRELVFVEGVDAIEIFASFELHRLLRASGAREEDGWG